MLFPRPPLERLALAARLTLNPLLWEQVETALNPLMPETEDLAETLKNQLQAGQAQAFTRALTSHHRWAVADLPWTEESPYPDLKYIYDPTHLYQRNHPSGGSWELLIPLYRYQEHQAAMQERQEALLQLRQGVRANLAALAREMRLKAPPQLLNLPGQMNMTLAYRSLPQLSPRERPASGAARRYLEEKLQRELQARGEGPGPLPAESRNGKAR